MLTFTQREMMKRQALSPGALLLLACAEGSFALARVRLGASAARFACLALG